MIVRYCRSYGSRLAHDNTGVQCGACHAKRRDVMVAAAAVPPEFWTVDQMRDALASCTWWTYRRWAPLS